MLILSFAFLLLAAGAFWLTSVHPARNVLRLRRTVVSFFVLMGLLSLALQVALESQGPDSVLRGGSAVVAASR